MLGPAAKASPRLTGDEAQIFLRAGIAPIGIGAKRYESAQILLRQFPSTGVLLLDDGFQHARIDRDFDIVVIDGLDPFGQDRLVPGGRLREPLSALARADAFIVTRAKTTCASRLFARVCAGSNPLARLFRTRLVARCWRDYRTGASRTDLGGARSLPFAVWGIRRASGEPWNRSESISYFAGRFRIITLISHSSCNVSPRRPVCTVRPC